MAKWWTKSITLELRNKLSDSKITFRIAATCRRFLKLLKLLSQVEFMRSTLISEFWMTGNSWQRFQILLNSRWLICWRPWCQVVFRFVSLIPYRFRSSQSVDKQAIAKIKMFPPTWLFYVINLCHLETYHILITNVRYADIHKIRKIIC